MSSRTSFLAHLAAPPSAYAPVPFWFWNDDLDEAELLRQLRALKDGGCGGVVIHPRIGLSERVGYLTPEYFRLVRRVADECAALDLRVILYDEGSYPSGSACGRVVAENPEHAARALVFKQQDVAGPHRGYWRVADGRSLLARPVCAVVGRVSAGVVDPASLQQLEVGDRGLVRLELGPGEWRVMACLDVPSGGTIRGALVHQEDGMATAPPAGDIMSPAAVAAFIRLTHDAYATALGDHLGHTVVAMFTDEPSPLGRGARRSAWPFTAGFDTWLAERLGQPVDLLHRWLPALWVDYGSQTQTFRDAYTAAVEARIGEVFYAAQAAWCAAHGVALTGHPHASNDMASLARFHWPGQDAVWRWVLPPSENESGLSGAHSVAAKAATSAARLASPSSTGQRIATELYGAYGWRLTLDEAKWLMDWHLARGNNLLIPHAAFYSVREGRAFESEPDLALHNCWWPHFQRLLRYGHRLSWLLSDCEHVCDVAIVAPGHQLPWEAARGLYERQIDFLYVDQDALGAASVADGRLWAGSQAYRSLVLDHSAGAPPLTQAAQAVLRDFERAGGLLLRAPLDAPALESLASLAREDVSVDPPAPDLRVLHVRKAGGEAYLLCNEGEGEIDTAVRVAALGARRWVDPLRMETAPCPGDGPIPLRLPRRESLVLLVSPAEDVTPGAPAPYAVPLPHAGRVLRELQVTGPWRVTMDGGREAPLQGPGDWTAVPALERLSGTLRYATTLHLDGGALARASSVVVDLATVGDAAEVWVNGAPAGFALWAPYQVLTGVSLWRPGENTLDVTVTNSAANAYEGAMRPSGLLGPVHVRLRG